tara:strand:- start:1513 stop:2190 length:678 start_codon:yes stop_codon:yes gene_type:complete
MSSVEIKLDHERQARIGLDEAILCAHKSTVQLETILDSVLENSARIMLTRLSSSQFESLDKKYQGIIDYDPISATGVVGPARDVVGPSEVVVVTAGTSDVRVAMETVRTLSYYGLSSRKLFDVGVAGLWRLLDHIEMLRRCRVVVVVAGMDGSLPSVIGGLVSGLVIAVPSSTGYGVASGGDAALRSALASCAPGLLVTNIDNGYGAACAAIRALGTANKTDMAT